MVVEVSGAKGSRICVPDRVEYYSVYTLSHTNSCDLLFLVSPLPCIASTIKSSRTFPHKASLESLLVVFVRPNRPVRCGCGVAGPIELELILRIASDSGIEAIELQRGRVKWRERRRGGENEGEKKKFRDLRD